MSNEIVNTSIVNDEALALLIHDLTIKHGKVVGKDTAGIDDFDKESDTGKMLIAVAHEINQTVIKPASERAAAYMLRNHHKALYDALPVGDVDAFDMLQVVNNHLDKVAGAIQMLETAEAEIVEVEKSK